jgi:hypothetical protein
MDEIKSEYCELYSRQELLIAPIRTFVQYEVPDGAPQEEAIVQYLQKMELQKAPGASGISVKQLQDWHYKARLSNDKCDKAIVIWEKILHLVNIAFTTSEVPTTFYNGAIVLIPKPKQQGYRGITLLETLYKLLSMIIHT